MGQIRYYYKSREKDGSSLLDDLKGMPFSKRYHALLTTPEENLLDLIEAINEAKDNEKPADEKQKKPPLKKLSQLSLKSSKSGHVFLKRKKEKEPPQYKSSMHDDETWKSIRKKTKKLTSNTLGKDASSHDEGIKEALGEDNKPVNGDFVLH